MSRNPNQLFVAGTWVLLTMAPAMARGFTPIERGHERATASVRALEADLDGDGRADKIQVTFFFGLNADVVDYVSVRAGGSELFLAGEVIDRRIADIVDLDTTDAKQELMLFEEGPSDDPATAFIGFGDDPHRRLSLLGLVGGAPGELRLLGDGMLNAQARNDLIDTWFHPQWYRLAAGHRLVPVEQELYAYGREVALRRRLELVRGREDTRPAFVLEPGDHGTLLASDGVAWVLVRAEDGRTGWFQVDGERRILPTRVSVDDVFDGLQIAD